MLICLHPHPCPSPSWERGRGEGIKVIAPSYSARRHSGTEMWRLGAKLALTNQERERIAFPLFCVAATALLSWEEPARLREHRFAALAILR